MSCGGRNCATVHIGEQSYYQGILAFGDADTLVGAIAVNFPRQREEQQIRRFFLIVAGIALVFSLLASVYFSLMLPHEEHHEGEEH